MNTTMPKISRESLMSLEAYAKARPEFRSKAIAHKRLRTVHIGEHITLLFEDETTIRYQIQEILLIPDGRNFKATMLIEYTEEAERRVALTRLKGVEDKTYIQVEGSKKVYAIADEDLERETDTKTSAVHFVRFELTEEMAAALKYGVSLSMGVDHLNYTQKLEPINNDTRNALVKDLR